MNKERQGAEPTLLSNLNAEKKSNLNVKMKKRDRVINWGNVGFQDYED